MNCPPRAEGLRAARCQQGWLHLAGRASEARRDDVPPAAGTGRNLLLRDRHSRRTGHDAGTTSCLRPASQARQEPRWEDRRGRSQSPSRTAEERTSRQYLHGPRHRNKDGKISKDEARGLWSDNFAQIDKNGDGALDRQEIEAACAAEHSQNHKGQGQEQPNSKK